jgi:Cu2+-exporting ATPase/Cu+-exporting ATPase
MTEKKTLPIRGMHCASCALTIEKAVRRVPGVTDASVNFATEKLSVSYDPSAASPDAMDEAVKPFGYSLDMGSGEEKGSQAGANAEHEGKAGGHDHHDMGAAELAAQKRIVSLTAPVALLVFVLMMWELAAHSFSWIVPFFLPGDLYDALSFVLASFIFFWAGRPFMRGVMRFVQTGAANMDTLIGIGTGAAYFYSALMLLFPSLREALGLPETMYFDVTIVVIGFVLWGKYLEARSKLKTGEAIRKLVGLQAKTALAVRDGREVEIPIADVRVGDALIIKPGSKIPVDGIIVEGASSVDESMITGEPIPVDKKPGDKLIGGTINKQGAMRMQASGVGADTMLAHIIRMVEEAQGSKAPIQKLADSISGIFVPVVLAVAALSFAAWILIGPLYMPFAAALTYGLLSMVGVLVIACPCALGLATPTAIVTGVGKGAQNGILIKNAESLEKLGSVSAIVMDKTGTLTEGRPRVAEVVLGESNHFASADDALAVLASLEKNSEHPLAQAIASYAEEKSLGMAKAERFSIIEGKGLTGTVDGRIYYAGNPALMRDRNSFRAEAEKKVGELSSQGATVVMLASEGAIDAYVAIADTLKQEARGAVEAMRKLGIEVVMATGDSEEAGKHMAAAAGIETVHAHVLPRDKIRIVRELQAQGRKVAMVGDGVNDAPALAQADVGIAMGSGTDAAIESADMTLLAGDIVKLSKAFSLSRATMRTIRQNLFWAFIYNAIGVPVAAGILYPLFGITLNPVFAGLAMALSSVSVIGNSLRLKAIRL